MDITIASEDHIGRGRMNRSRFTGLAAGLCAIASGLGAGAKVKLENTPEMRDQRNATVLYVFG